MIIMMPLLQTKAGWYETWKSQIFVIFHDFRALHNITVYYFNGFIIEQMRCIALLTCHVVEVSLIKLSFQSRA